MLLGAVSATKVSRYESFERIPTALTVFALEVVFNQPASELFAGHYHAVRLAVQERAKSMVEKLNTRPNAPDRTTRRKLELLRSIVESKPTSA